MKNLHEPLKNNSEINSLIITNSLGKVVYQNEVRNENLILDISKFSEGFYFITIQNSKGRSSTILQIVKLF